MKCVTITFLKRTMLHKVEPLTVHSQYEQADRPTQSLLIHIHTINSCFSVNLYKNTQKKDLPSGNFVCLQFVWGKLWHTLCCLWNRCGHRTAAHSNKNRAKFAKTDILKDPLPEVDLRDHWCGVELTWASTALSTWLFVCSRSWSDGI